jgi:hypothetical protein
VGIVGFAMQAQAVVVVSGVGGSGSVGISQDTCLQGLVNAVGDGENCMYDGGPAGGGNTPLGQEVTGSYNHVVFYDSLANPAAFQTTIVGSARNLYTPVNGDGKMAQNIIGLVSVDDGGDGFGAGDLISFSLTLTSSGGGNIIRHLGASIVEQYSSMTQILAPVAASSATANGLGGFDYIIGSEGFPALLTFAGPGCVGANFGSVECGHSFTPGVGDPDYWSGVAGAGLGSLENNLGAKTTGNVTGLQCIDSRSAAGAESNDCRDSQVGYSPFIGVTGSCLVTGGCVVGTERGASEDVSWDQLLLRVSTDAAGNVVSLAGYNVDDYRVFRNTRCGDNTTGSGTYATVCNSWTSGYFTASLIPVPAAVWMFGSAVGLLGWIRRRAR